MLPLAMKTAVLGGIAARASHGPAESDTARIPSREAA